MVLIILLAGCSVGRQGATAEAAVGRNDPLKPQRKRRSEIQLELEPTVSAGMKNGSAPPPAPASAHWLHVSRVSAHMTRRSHVRAGVQRCVEAIYVS